MGLSTVEAGQGLGGGRYVREEIDCCRDYRIKLYIFKHFVIVTSINEDGLQHGRDDVSDLSAAGNLVRSGKGAFNRRCKGRLGFFTCYTMAVGLRGVAAVVWRLPDANAEKLGRALEARKVSGPPQIRS